MNGWIDPDCRAIATLLVRAARRPTRISSARWVLRVPGDVGATLTNAVPVLSGKGQQGKAVATFEKRVRFGYYDNLSSEERRVYDASDRVRAIRLHQPARFAGAVGAVRSALEAGQREEVEHATQMLLDAVADALEVPRIQLRVLLTRPSSAWSELHGLYTHPPGHRPTIEVWMRTARHGRVVAFRTYLRTVLHELCHHIDFAKLGFEWSFHTRGFFQRESSLVNQLAPRPRASRAPRRGLR